MSEEEKAAQIAAIAACLDGFPAQSRAPEGSRVPIPARSREGFAAELYAKGLKYDAAAATLFPIPGTEQAMGFLNPTRWVGREEFEAWVAEHPESRHDEIVRRLTEALEVINPDLAHRIPTMTEQQRRDQVRTHHDNISRTAHRINELAQLHRRETEGEQP